MAITSAMVLYAVTWFMTLFVVLPIRLQTQGDVGKIARGTMAGAPVDPQIKKRAIITTVIATIIWVIIVSVIISGVITVDHLDYFNRGSGPVGGGTNG